MKLSRLPAPSYDEALAAEGIRGILGRCLEPLLSGRYVQYLRLLVLSGEEATSMNVERADRILSDVAAILRGALRDLADRKLIQVEPSAAIAEQLIVMVLGFGFLRSIMTGDAVPEAEIARNVDAAVSHFLRGYAVTNG